MIKDPSPTEYSVMMSAHTSMRVGGPASFFYKPAGEEELLSRITSFYNAGMPYILLGNGTNVIVRDEGYPGAVLLTLNALKGIEISTVPPDLQNPVVCGAGESLSRVCRYAAEHGLSGFEELSGIPGTVGGAVYMNAGAYDREISDIVISVRIFDVFNNKYIMLSNEECAFSYRTSIFRTKQYVILSATFLLNRGKREAIEAKMAHFKKIRNAKQPVDLPSSGSFFKRPKGMYAAKLIEDAGMKGVSVGGAMVSDKHAGFIVNTGNASADDVLNLSGKVKTEVFKKFHVLLEEEPIIIGV